MALNEGHLFDCKFQCVILTSLFPKLRSILLAGPNVVYQSGGRLFALKKGSQPEDRQILDLSSTRTIDGTCERR